jgi:polyhydroxybutyrate depolymerase
MMIHGTNDPTVPYTGLGTIGTEESIAIWLNKNQCSLVNDNIDVPNTNTTDTATAQRINYRSCADNTELLFYKINGGGHTWPNALINTNYGPTCRDFDGSAEIWNFFNRYSLSGPLGVTEQEKDKLEANVFPNPFTTQLTIDATVLVTKAEIWNTMGQLVGQMQNPLGIHSLNLSSLTSGIYYLKLNGNNGIQTKIIYKGQ